MTDHRTWLESLSDDALLDHRFTLYDRLELVDEDSDVHAALRVLDELNVVYALERERDIRRGLRLMCAVTAPYADPDAFANAVIDLARLQRELGSDTDAGEIFTAALEVAQRRAALSHGQTEPEHT